MNRNRIKFKTAGISRIVRQAMGRKRLLRLWRESQKGIKPRTGGYHLLRLQPSGEDCGPYLFHAPSCMSFSISQINADLFLLVTGEDGEAERLIAVISRSYSTDELAAAFRRHKVLTDHLEATTTPPPPREEPAPVKGELLMHGNLMTENAEGALTTYSWDWENCLIGVSSPSGVETYAYSADGMREEKENSSGIVYYVRDGENVLIETDAGLVTQAHYTDFPGVWGGLTSERRGGVSSFYGFDQQSNARILASINGNVTDEYLYKAFGEEVAVSGATVNSLRFGGQVGYWRDEAERLYVRARYLRTDMGRWMSRDPIGLKGGVNSYVYVRNRSTNLYDPLGLISLHGIKHNICVGACYVDYGIMMTSCAEDFTNELKDCLQIFASCYVVIWTICSPVCIAICGGPEDGPCITWCTKICGAVLGGLELKYCHKYLNICMSKDKCNLQQCTQNANIFLQNCLAYCAK